MALMTARAVAPIAIVIALVGAIVVMLRIDFGPPAPRVVVTGEAAVGGPFHLTDQQGRNVSDVDFRGRLMLIYFGYASDPDLTPASLQVMAGALQRLGADADAIVPIFITLDPERDTQEKLRSYVASFHPRLLGLRGTVKETGKITTAYRLYVTRITSPPLPGGYSMDHQSLYYVMGRDGRFIDHVPHTTDPGELAGEIRRVIRRR